jgi:hypothetical protein
VSSPDPTPHLVVPKDPDLHARLDRLARESRLLFVAGLPGTGKSLLVHQIAHLAASAGRSVHLLQWDVARPVLEESAAGRRFPAAAGVTHPMVRKAVGLWSRRAVLEWERWWTGPEHVLLGETPFVGNRLIELARPALDDAEPLLAGPACRFAIAVPSPDVRRVLEQTRERRAAAPLHPREREDAPPAVLRDLWRQLVEAARALGIAPGAGDDRAPAYDPVLYQRVYEALLLHRRVEILALRTVLPTEGLSVYDFAMSCHEVKPREADAEAIVRATEARYPDPAALVRDVDRWWIV